MLNKEKQSFKIPILDIIVEFGGIDEMNADAYAQEKYSNGSFITACSWSDGGIIKFAYSDELTYSVLVHEICHLVNLIFGIKGIQPDLHNDEFQAYLMGYLFKALAERIFQ